ncbi:MAG: TonB family protein [Acidobacteria bacterium]|nr:TonB family protein [Acidobacteriota bacterium]
MPEEAQTAGIQGVVILEVVVDETGAVTNPRVVRSVPLLDEARARGRPRVAVRADAGERPSGPGHDGLDGDLHAPMMVTKRAWELQGDRAEVRT